jgi:putative endonuclease
VRYAHQRGWIVIETNIQTPSGEIDLVVRDGEAIALIEVRTRRTNAFGTGPESLTTRKRARMASCAYEYLAARGFDPHSIDWRVDLIAVVLAPGRAPEVEHLSHVLAD